MNQALDTIGGVSVTFTGTEACTKPLNVIRVNFTQNFGKYVCCPSGVFFSNTNTAPLQCSDYGCRWDRFVRGFSD